MVRQSQRRCPTFVYMLHHATHCALNDRCRTGFRVYQGLGFGVILALHLVGRLHACWVNQPPVHYSNHKDLIAKAAEKPLSGYNTLAQGSQMYQEGKCTKTVQV